MNFVDVANIWAVAWLLAHSPVTVPIPGTSKVSHAADNAAIGRLRLTHAEIARLDAVS